MKDKPVSDVFEMHDEHHRFDVDKDEVGHGRN